MRKRRRPRREVDDWRLFRQTTHVDDAKIQNGRKPLLRWPMGSDKKEFPRRDRNLLSDSEKKRRRRKCVSPTEAPRLRQGVERCRSRRIAPREKMGKMSRHLRREEVHFRETPTANDGSEDLRRKMPIRRRQAARCRIGEEILFRRYEDWKNPNVAVMKTQEDLPGCPKKKGRYCATFFSDIREGSHTVCPPEQLPLADGWGKEVQKEYVEGTQFLRIDMGWGIHNVLPEAVMETALEINAPALVRRVG